MPQVTRLKRQGLLDQTEPITEVGDLCYLITARHIIPTWMMTPRWATISRLRKELVQDPDLVKLKAICRGSPFADTEIINQAALAFMEFYRRVAANYENEMARKNSDVYANVLYSKSAQLMRGE